MDAPEDKALRIAFEEQWARTMARGVVWFSVVGGQVVSVPGRTPDDATCYGTVEFETPSGKTFRPAAYGAKFFDPVALDTTLGWLKDSCRGLHLSPYSQRRVP